MTDIIKKTYKVLINYSSRYVLSHHFMTETRTAALYTAKSVAICPLLFVLFKMPPKSRY